MSAGIAHWQDAYAQHHGEGIPEGEQHDDKYNGLHFM
jgi:hypothetical protein